MTDDERAEMMKRMDHAMMIENLENAKALSTVLERLDYRTEAASDGEYGRVIRNTEELFGFELQGLLEGLIYSLEAANNG